MRLAILAASLLLAAPALADVKAGVDAWTRGDYRQAVEEWRAPAVAGDADAQFNLGQAYKLGRGVPVDPQMAESWFRKAALQGHEQAQDNYGLALFQSGRKAEAVRWLEQSVARDEPRAELVYGTMLFNGDGVGRDYPRAYALMSRAAAARPPANGLPGSDGLQSARETLAQMDPFITGPDRERGTALAQQIAITAQGRPATAPRPLRVTEEAARAPVAPAASPPPPVATARPKPTTRPVAVAARPAPAQPSRGGKWKVQLGAFRDRGNAEALWARVRGKLGGGTPAYVAGGGFTRLQATGFADRAAAQSACRRAGTACSVVAP
ncbi:SPOR domain-containing protein [Sphingomonas sp.]|uniref:SPOR domain-containing protein n=1 Tax=Sphingomonas sp. TaxID=28214 RepID=UPI003AFF7737